MDIDKSLIYEIKNLLLARYPRFGSEVAKANIEYRTDLKYHTAAADGRNVYIDPEYFKGLSEDDRLFLIAHEFMHNKFLHMYRLKDPNGVMRDTDVWNEATDAIINANLERDGFTIKRGYVNRPEAINYSAEEFYEILLKEREEKQKNSKQNNQSGQDKGEQDENGQTGENSKQDNASGEKEQDNQSGNDERTENQSNGSSENEGQENEQGQNSEEEEKFMDDHSMWEEAFQESENGAKKRKQENNPNKSEKNDGKPSEQSSEQKSDDIRFEFDERSEFEKNREEQLERVKERFDKTKRRMRGEQVPEGSIDLGSVGESRNEIDWKLLLRREVEKSETIWSQRRSVAENNYAYRLEENEVEEEAETEVMIDVSGSVDLELVKAFLRELKPIIKQSKLKVGCFNEKFWGLVDIKNVKDIDNFTIPRGARGHSAWTKDWDLAVRSFSKKREINKIVFTDGYPCPGTMPKEDLRRENVIWMVYGNKSFNPCCGRVINITEKQLGKLHQVYQEQER